MECIDNIGLATTDVFLVDCSHRNPTIPDD